MTGGNNSTTNALLAACSNSIPRALDATQCYGTTSTYQRTARNNDPPSCLRNHIFHTEYTLYGRSRQERTTTGSFSHSPPPLDHHSAKLGPPSQCDYYVFSHALLHRPMWSPSGFRHTSVCPPNGVPLQAHSSSILTGPVYGGGSSSGPPASTMSLLGMADSGRQTNNAWSGSVSVVPDVALQYPPAQYAVRIVASSKSESTGQQFCRMSGDRRV